MCAPSARRWASMKSARPVSRGVCPRRFGGLRDCGEDLLLRRPELVREDASGTLPPGVVDDDDGTSHALTDDWLVARHTSTQQDRRPSNASAETLSDVNSAELT